MNTALDLMNTVNLTEILDIYKKEGISTMATDIDYVSQYSTESKMVWVGKEFIALDRVDNEVSYILLRHFYDYVSNTSMRYEHSPLDRYYGDVYAELVFEHQGIDIPDRFMV